ncbi:MAG: carbohydrate kinase family protein [bacterium]|nr:carbohydrate kinase family protein [bacterium]
MHDFLAIGDIVTDAFIKLKDASVHCDIDKKNCVICMPFAEKIPYESVEEVSAVGNSPNASVAAARLGLKSALVTNLGDDEEGKKCLEKLKQENVFTELVYVHQGKKSNYHYVLWYEADRTILVKHEEYEYKLPDLGEPKWVYLSSLGAKAEDYHKELSAYLKTHKNIQLAFQPGTYQLLLGPEHLKDIYSRTKIFVSNVGEAGRVLGMETLGIKEMLKRLKELGPEMVVITDGPKGAHAYDGNEMWHQPSYPDPKPPVDRTGAGDALASTTVAALSMGQDLETAMKWGMINAMSVVQEVGAQKGLLSREKIEEYLKNAPPEFQSEKLN